MKTTITITFQGESLLALRQSRTVSIDGPVQLPNIGEYVQNFAYVEGEMLGGTLVSRSFLYRKDELNVTLLLLQQR